MSSQNIKGDVRMTGDKVQFKDGSNKTTIQAGAPASDIVLTLPSGSSDTIVGAATSQTVSNKTLDNTNTITVESDKFTVQDTTDNTKQVVISAANVATGTTRTLSAPNVNGTIVTTGDTGTVTSAMLASNIDAAKIANGSVSDAEFQTLSDISTGSTIQSQLNTKETVANVSAHTSNTSNPHSVTKAQVGLGSADNTSDLDKPISTATQTALNLKADSSALTSHTGDTANPHSVTKTQVGLGNVDNTSDANKPISSATQTALDAKVTGPASATDNALVRFDATTGKLVQNSGVTLSDTNDMAGVASLSTTDNINVDNGKEIRLYETDANGSHYIGVKAPDNTTASKTFVLPNGDGSSGQAIGTDGLGNLGWITPVAADVNGNIPANAFISGFTSTATAAGTTTLTVASDEIQEFTGTTTQTCRLPTTSVVAGQRFTIRNSSTGIVTVQSSGANTIQAMAPSSAIMVMALVNTPTTAAHWSVISVGGAYPANSTGTAAAAGYVGERKSTALTTNMSTPATAGNYQDSAETRSLESGIWNLRFRGSITMTSGASVGSTLDHRVEIQITDASNNIIARCATGARFTGASQTLIQSFEFGDIVYPSTTTTYKIRVRTNHNNDASGVNGIIYANGTVLSGAVVQETVLFATRIV